MASDFDAVELRKVRSDVFKRVLNEALKTKSTGTALDNAEDAAVLAVAAYVREATLREAAGVCEALADAHEAEAEASFHRGDTQGRLSAMAKCEVATSCALRLAASARETGGAK
jgi:hypothetical protein